MRRSLVVVVLALFLGVALGYGGSESHGAACSYQLAAVPTDKGYLVWRLDVASGDLCLFAGDGVRVQPFGKCLSDGK